MASRHFRAGVVAVIERSDGAVLAFERADAPGSWQLPQGGIEVGEEPEDAVWRELKEIGQIQRWFTFRVNDDSVEPSPDGSEFVAWRWVESGWLVRNVVAFRRPAYERVLGTPHLRGN